MSTHTPEQLQEINDFEDRYGFPGFIEVGMNPEVAVNLTPTQRQHARAWLRIANDRFGAELQGQLGRWPTVSELCDRLDLSIKLHQHGDGRTTRPAPLTH